MVGSLKLTPLSKLPIGEALRELGDPPAAHSFLPSGDAKGGARAGGWWGRSAGPEAGSEERCSWRPEVVAPGRHSRAAESHKEVGEGEGGQTQKGEATTANSSAPSSLPSSVPNPQTRAGVGRNREEELNAPGFPQEILKLALPWPLHHQQQRRQQVLPEGGSRTERFAAEQVAEVRGEFGDARARL